jgi:hypothetical protein
MTHGGGGQHTDFDEETLMHAVLYHATKCAIKCCCIGSRVKVSMFYLMKKCGIKIKIL